MATKKAKITSDKLAWRFEALAKPVHYRDTDSKYVGADEPQYPDIEKQRQWSASEYKLTLMRALGWYGHTQDKKKSAEWLATFLERNPRRAKLAAAVRKGEVWPGSTVGYALRAGRVGLELRFGSLRTLLRLLKQAEAEKKKVITEEVKEEKKQTFNIQERLAEKTAECGGEIEGRFDDFITVNEFKGEPKAVELLSQFNVQPGHIKSIITLAEKRIAEYEELLTTKDSQLLEAYRHYGKRQINAIIKWWQQVLADCNSYGIIKKANKAPRKKKAVSPEKVVSKLKFLKEFTELKLKSIEPTQILTAEELWVYNTKTRKLGIYVADSHQVKLSVKGTGIFGFDSALSVQKTLRKPKEQLKEWSGHGKPAAKKWFKGIRTTETKLNGRTNADVILLKAYK